MCKYFTSFLYLKQRLSTCANHIYIHLHVKPSKHCLMYFQQSSVPPLSVVLSEAKSQCVNHLVLVLQGTFTQYRFVGVVILNFTIR